VYKQCSLDDSGCGSDDMIDVDDYDDGSVFEGTVTF